MTNAISLVQLAANHAGYNVSGADIAMALTLTGTIAAGLTHLAAWESSRPAADGTTRKDSWFPATKIIWCRCRPG